jgi:hypothetical protein
VPVVRRAAASGELVAPRARHAPQRLVRWDWYRRRPELFVTSDPLARAITAVAAVAIVVATVLWWFEAWNRVVVPGIIRPVWFRIPQFALALAGIVTAAVEVAYLADFAVTGTVWRRWRGVTAAFAAVSIVWTALWLLDRFVLDQVFIG